jgi:protein-tyrosine-phosphatase
MPKIIEMVCTGNQGRSPVAELIAQNHLASQGALDEYQASSSGTSVDALTNGELSRAFMIRIVSIGRGRGIYSPTENQSIDEAISAGANDTIQALYQKAKKTFDKEEHQYRSEAVQRFDIEGALKERTEQTIAQGDRIAVFSMAQNNNAAVQGIYAENKFSPIITVLSAYVLGESQAQLPNTFGRSQEVYFDTVAQLREQVPKAMDKLLI